MLSEGLGITADLHAPFARAIGRPGQAEAEVRHASSGHRSFEDRTQLENRSLRPEVQFANGEDD